MLNVKFSDLTFHIAGTASHVTLCLRTSKMQTKEVFVILHSRQDIKCPFAALTVLHKIMLKKISSHSSSSQIVDRIRNCTIAEFPTFFGFKKIDSNRLTALLSFMLKVHTTNHTWRRSGAQYYLYVLKLNESYVMQYGRWSDTSHDFHKYVRGPNVAYPINLRSVDSNII